LFCWPLPWFPFDCPCPLFPGPVVPVAMGVGLIVAGAVLLGAAVAVCAAAWHPPGGAGMISPCRRWAGSADWSTVMST
jgi:hypothetical protein